MKCRLISALVLTGLLLGLGWLVSGVQSASPAVAKEVQFPSGESLPVTSGPEGKEEEYYDPHNSGNPLLDVRGVNASRKLSRDFKASEFARSGDRTFSRVRIDPELVRCLQKIRDHVGRPVVITSGYRSYQYNKEVYEKRGEEPTLSRHLSGQAADVKVAGLSGLDIARAALEAYGVDIGVGIGATYAHLDVRGKWARWTYFKGEKNIKTIREIDAYREKLLKK